MDMWNDRFRRRLERQLRAERPEPPAEFVSRLTRELPRPLPRPGRGIVPRAILVASLSVALATGLGVTGALGYAAHSLHHFSDNVVRIVSPPAPTFTSNIGTSLDGFGGTEDRTDKHSQSGDPQGGQGNGDPGFGDLGTFAPFNHQYGIRVPICVDGHIVLIPLEEYIYLLLHGHHFSLGCFFRR